jgi:hypothetical protein
MKFGNLNFLEPSGPLQACNGADCITFNYLKIIVDILKPYRKEEVVKYEISV